MLWLSGAMLLAMFAHLFFITSPSAVQAWISKFYTLVPWRL
jgi:hypothetical protein